MDNALGIGVDIMLVDRMRSCLDDAFVRGTFTAAEQALASDRGDRVTYFAKLFAGKEAVFKSFGISGECLDSWLDVEISDGESGAPEVRLYGSLARVAAERGADAALVSLSHDGGYVLAACLLVRRQDHDR